ncbi:CS1 type fimbrial major subunit [Enterobacter bugandensis]
MKFVKYSILGLCISSANVMAAVDPIEHTITVTANVPTSAFYVTPVNDWINTPQVMAWDPLNESLNPITQQFQIKSTEGAVTAKLLNNPIISSDTDSIPLSVSLNGKVVDTATKTEILTKEEAPQGLRVPVKISSSHSGTYQPGDYSGYVNILFETAAP